MSNAKRTSVFLCEPWKPEEDLQLQTLQADMGCKWQRISDIMVEHGNRRSVNSVRNRFNRLTHKKHRGGTGCDCKLRYDQACDANEEEIVSDKPPFAIPNTLVSVPNESHDLTSWYDDFRQFLQSSSYEDTFLRVMRNDHADVRHMIAEMNQMCDAAAQCDE